jgi:ribosomal protein L37E
MSVWCKKCGKTTFNEEKCDHCQQYPQDDVKRYNVPKNKGARIVNHRANTENAEKKIKNGIIAFLITIAISVLVTLIQKWSGVIDSGLLLLSLMFYSIFLIIPYKIYRGRNWARYVYIVIFIMHIIMFLGIIKEMKNIEIVFTIISIPFGIYSILCFFNEETKEWFD